MKTQIVLEWDDSKFSPEIAVKCGGCGATLTASEIVESPVSEIVEHAWQAHRDHCVAAVLIIEDKIGDVKRTFARLDSKYGNDWTEWQDVREAIAKL